VRHFLSLTVLLCVLGCGGKVKEEVRLKGNFGEKFEFAFDTDSLNAEAFGLWRYGPPGPSVRSVSSIARDSNLVYLLDPIHRNIKVLDLRNGQIKLSPTLVGNPEDLAVLGDKILVCGSDSSLYVLDHALQMKGIAQLNRWGVWRFLKLNGQLFVYDILRGPVQDKNDFSVTLNATRVTHRISLIDTAWNVGKGYAPFQALVDPVANLADSATCMPNANRQFCADRAISRKGSFYDWARDIYVDDTSISFFEVLGTKLIVTSYLFE
jgi:hypothetical protein